MSMNVRSSPAAAVLISAWISACAAATDPAEPVEAAKSELRQVSNDEALADFDQMVGAFRNWYGVIQRKESLYDFHFDDLVSEYRERVAKADVESDYLGVYLQFLSRFHDGHLGLVTHLLPDTSRAFSLPFSVMPIEDTYVVYYVVPASGGKGADGDIARGDELVSIDGVPVEHLVEQFSTFISAPNPISVKHTAAGRLTSRRAYLSAGLSDQAPVTVRVRDARGRERDVELKWQELEHVLPPVSAADSDRNPVSAATAFSTDVEEVTSAESRSEGEQTPFFLTEQVRATYGFGPSLTPSPAALTTLGLTAEAAAGLQQTIFAATYHYDDKTILLLRLPNYSVADTDSLLSTLKYMVALLQEQATLVDALVFDQTHNPGGSIALAEYAAAMLSKASLHGWVQRMHADRRWIEAFLADAADKRTTGGEDNLAAAAQDESYAREVDAAYSNHQALSEPIPFAGLTPDLPVLDVGWNKPVVVLIDELTVSASEMASMLIKVNHVAPLFGARTLGAGGNVEPVTMLTNTSFTLRLSRGLGAVYDPTGTYPADTIVEDNGVVPDIAYEHTLQDFRAGYVGYVEAFSRALCEHTAAP
jgi:hypothetical protein